MHNRRTHLTKARASYGLVMTNAISTISKCGKKSRARLPTRAVVRNTVISKLISRSGTISIVITTAASYSVL